MGRTSRNRFPRALSWPSRRCPPPGRGSVAGTPRLPGNPPDLPSRPRRGQRPGPGSSRRTYSDIRLNREGTHDRTAGARTAQARQEAVGRLVRVIAHKPLHGLGLPGPGALPGLRPRAAPSVESGRGVVSDRSRRAQLRDEQAAYLHLIDFAQRR